MISIASYLKAISAFQIDDLAEAKHWVAQLNDRYGIDLKWDNGTHDVGDLAKEIYRILRPIPEDLVRACKVTTLELRSNMGSNLPFYPNHGFYQVPDLIVLNTDMFYHPDQPNEFMDHRGYFLTRAQETLVHELGHALDFVLGEPSLKPAWMKLSGWSHTPQPGLKQLIIRDKGVPEIRGDMWYDSKARFTRFYGKKNSYDDWADCFAFYIGGLRHNMPAEKNGYFDELLGKYYV